jgi:hypothetical protein
MSPSPMRSLKATENSSFGGATGRRVLRPLKRNFHLQILFEERPEVSLFFASIHFLAASESASSSGRYGCKTGQFYAKYKR